MKPRPQNFDQLICLISAMDRQVLIERLVHFRGDFPVDFTDEFLQREPTERLQHIYLALCLHHGQVATA